MTAETTHTHSDQTHSDQAGGQVGHSHADHDHPAHLQHHFHSEAQQFDAAKLGMWAFLAQELLFFTAVFVAYAVVRFFYPETMLSAHELLSVPMGTINTFVLITSSLTMALAVRAAQLNQFKALSINLILTIFFAFCFMGIKAKEYSHKFHEGFFPGKYFTGVGLLPHEMHGSLKQSFRLKSDPETVYYRFDSGVGIIRDEVISSVSGHGMGVLDFGPVPDAMTVGEAELEMAQSFNGGSKDVATWGKDLVGKSFAMRFSGKPHVFFGIYFTMTGLHGLHVVIGIGLLLWILIGGQKRKYHSAYYTPVEMVGLYWHLVDLIWIFLFPLLYLVR